MRGVARLVDFQWNRIICYVRIRGSNLSGETNDAKLLFTSDCTKFLTLSLLFPFACISIYLISPPQIYYKNEKNLFLYAKKTRGYQQCDIDNTRNTGIARSCCKDTWLRDIYCDDILDFSFRSGSYPQAVFIWSTHIQLQLESINCTILWHGNAFKTRKVKFLIKDLSSVHLRG